MYRLRLGDRGAIVAEVKGAVASLGLLDSDGAGTEPRRCEEGVLIAADALFDGELDRAVRAFQQQRGLLVDGVVGPTTYRALKEASYRLGARTLCYQLSAPMFGDDVGSLQSRLQELGFYIGRVDGYFGPDTHAALCAFQHEIGISADGICGPATIRSLDLLGSHVTGGSPHAMSEEELVRSAGPHLTGKRIVIDPGLGGDDTGPTIESEYGPVTEEFILWDVASRLEGRMAATGMETHLSRSRSANPRESDRAEIANSIGADLTISLRCARHTTSAAHGVAGFHFGNNRRSESLIGQVLAGYIQREIVARTSLQDCRIHGRTWDLLRLTRMPTVQVDLGYITNPEDSSVLANPHYRDIIAHSILVAVKRLYLLGQDDQPTGTYTFAELLAEELAAGRPA